MGRTRAPVPTIAEQLRTLIDQDGRSNYELGKAAGVPEATLWRFRKGERDMQLETAGEGVHGPGRRAAEGGKAAKE